MSAVFERILAHEDATFRRAVVCALTGDAAGLGALLDAHPDLARARSRSPHHATLLHYVAANGIEDALQVSPLQAPDVARVLIAAGSEVDALCDTYGGGTLQTTLNLLVSSVHPAAAGVMTALVDVLCESGANVNGVADDGSPLATALAFGYPQAVGALVRRGGRTDNIVFAAAAGRLADVQAYFEGNGWIKADVGRCRIDWFKMSDDPRVAADQALVYAAMCGQQAVVVFLLDRGVSVDAAPPGSHVTATPLHTAAWQGDEAMVRLLLDRGADKAMKDRRHGATPRAWAEHAGHDSLARLL